MMSQLLTDMSAEEIDVYADQIFHPKPKPAILPKPTIKPVPKRKSGGSHRHGPAPKRKRVRGHVRKVEPKSSIDTPNLVFPISNVELPHLLQLISPVPPPIEPPPALVSSVTCSTVADPGAYVLDVFDNFIAPGIVATPPNLEIIRRAIYRRAVAEFGAEEIRLMSAMHSISVEDIVTITMASVNKAGLILI